MDKTFNLKEPFSKLPISQRVKVIAPKLLKAILQFCITNKLFEFKKRIHLKDLNQICNLFAFEHILDRDLEVCLGLVSSTQSSPPTTFKIVITGLLNEQML